MRACNQQLTMLAITDHDSIAGLLPAAQACQQFSDAPTLVPGVEISCAWQGHEIHVVGLNFSVDHSAITTLLEQQSTRRINRAQRIAEKLQRCGLNDCWQKVSALAGDALPTRAHFAQLLINEQWVSRKPTAFKKYLKKGKRAYVTPQWCSIPEACTAILAAGGWPVLAHPIDYRLSDKWLGKLINDFAEAGGLAIEVAQCRLMPSQRQKLAELAASHQLLASAGSDFHFPGGWVELGKGLKMPEQAVPVWHSWKEIKGVI